jgi:hypothetical protein
VFYFRHLPVVTLLASCNVYGEGLLDDDVGAPDNAGALSSAGASGLTSALGGRSPGSAGNPQEAESPGGEGASIPDDRAGASHGGSSPVVGGSGSAETAGASSQGGVTAGSDGGGPTNPPSGVDLLDDMEDGNFYIAPKPPRYGFWYVAGDTTAGAKLPKIEELIGTLVPSREASTSAVHFTASGFKGWGSSVGLSFTDAGSKRGAYDAGGAFGVSFWVRGSVSDNVKLRVLFPLMGTDPTGKLCGGTQQGQCLDHFATQVSVGPDWQQVTLLFSSLHQAGWGVPLAAFDPKQLLGIEWSAAIANVDVWIDDLALLRP